MFFSIKFKSVRVCIKPVQVVLLREADIIARIFPTHGQVVAMMKTQGVTPNQFSLRLLCSVAVLLLSIQSLFAVAAIDVYEFDSEQTRERYLHFIDELRCPKCQNQNLAGSDSAIAADLRRELHRLLEEGKSDDEIVDFMVSRYGEYILYNPRVTPSTYLLWYGPLAMLALGVVVLILVVRARRRTRAEQAAASEGPTLNASEQARLAALLEASKANSDGSPAEEPKS